MDKNREHYEALSAVYLADRAELTAIDSQLMNLASIGVAYVFGVGAVWATKTNLHIENYQYALIPIPITALLIVWLARWRVCGATARSARRVQKDLLRDVGYSADTLKHLGIMAHYPTPRRFWTYVAGSAMFGTPLAFGAAISTACIVSIYHRSGFVDPQTIGVGASYTSAYLSLVTAFILTLRNQGVRLAHDMKIRELEPPRGSLS